VTLLCANPDRNIGGLRSDREPMAPTLDNLDSRNERSQQYSSTLIKSSIDLDDQENFIEIDCACRWGFKTLLDPTQFAEVVAGGMPMTAS
jgi:hypothetical protein